MKQFLLCFLLVLSAKSIAQNSAHVETTARILSPRLYPEKGENEIVVNDLQNAVEVKFSEIRVSGDFIDGSSQEEFDLLTIKAPAETSFSVTFPEHFSFFEGTKTMHLKGITSVAEYKHRDIRIFKMISSSVSPKISSKEQKIKPLAVTLHYN